MPVFAPWAKWLNYTYVDILFCLLFHYAWSQDSKYSPLSYTVGPFCLFILYILVWILLIPNSRSLPFLLPLQQLQICSLCLWVCFCSTDKFIVSYFIFHIQMISHGVCLPLSNLPRYDNLWFHPCSCRWHCFILFVAGIPLCICTTSSLSIHLMMDI